MLIFKQTFGDLMYLIMSKIGQNIFLICVGLHLFMNEMDLNVDVFTSFMKLKIFS
jgi:hypothetical protein